MEIRLLGRFSVRRGGEEVPPGAFGGRLARRLVRILLTRRGEFVPRDLLIDSLWGHNPPADPEANLNVLVNRARRALGDPSLIVTAEGGYHFAVDAHCSVDTETFLAHLDGARRSLASDAPREALERFTAALDAWGGEPLPEDTYDEWAQDHRRMLLHAHHEALEGAASAALAAGDPVQAVGLAERCVEEEPLREASHLLLVRALAATGDRAAALAAFQAMRERLVDELGIDPSPEGQALHTRILRGEPVASTRATVGAPAVETPLGELPFAGRDHELRLALSALTVDPPAPVVVVGPAGSGKTRLLAELAHRVRRRLLEVRAFLPERDQPWSLTRTLLREAVAVDVEVSRAIPARAASALADLAPGLGLDAERRELDPETRRALLLEGAIRAVEAAAGGGGLLIADDLQWADASSLQFLALVRARVPSLAMALAYRSEEVGAEDPLADLVADLQATSRPTLIRLGALPADALGALAGERLVEILVAETDRTPFTIREVIRTLTARGAIQRGGDRRWHIRSERVEDGRELARAGQDRATVMRVERQPPTRRELLRLLALLDREAPARTLATATGRDERDVLRDLDALGRAELVRLGEHGWATAHDLIAATTRDTLDQSERGRLHGLLAEALTAEDADPGEEARHLAGAGDSRAAAERFARAASLALDRYADQEARRLAEAGLELDPPPETRTHLLEARAEARARRGDLSGAREDLRGAIGIARDGARRARLLTRTALLALGAEDLLHADELVELALTEAGEDPTARGNALLIGAVVDTNLERQERARVRSDEALHLFGEIGDARGVARILDERAMASFLDGHITEAIDAFDRVAALFADAGDLLHVVTPRSTRGHALVFHGQPRRGLEDTEDALALARTLGHREGEAYSLWHRSEALSALDRGREALESAEASLAIARDIGHRGWTATALRAIGIAHETLGDHELAEEFFRRSLDASRHLPLFACWAAARLARVLTAGGRLAEASPFVSRALDEGPGLGLYEARVAEAELAFAMDAPNAAELAGEARERALSGGHLASADHLAALLT